MRIRRPTMSRTATFAVVVLAITVAGCGGSESTAEGGTESSPTQAPTAAPTTTPTPTPTPAPTPEGTASEPTTAGAEEPAEADLPAPATEPTESDGFPTTMGEGPVFLDSVELGDHEGYERVVFTFDGAEALPSWRVEYVDEVRQSGSGNPVEVAGSAYLNVTLSGATGVDLSGEQPEEVYTGPDRLSGSDAALSAVQEVVEAGDFEATMSWAIGVDEQRPFRAFTLTDPARLVVDVVTS